MTSIKASLAQKFVNFDLTHAPDKLHTPEISRRIEELVATGVMIFAPDAARKTIVDTQGLLNSLSPDDLTCQLQYASRKDNTQIYCVAADPRNSGHGHGVVAFVYQNDANPSPEPARAIVDIQEGVKAGELFLVRDCLNHAPVPMAAIIQERADRAAGVYEYKKFIDDMTRAYLEAAVWSDGESLDNGEQPDFVLSADIFSNFSDLSVQHAYKQCEKFYADVNPISLFTDELKGAYLRNNSDGSNIAQKIGHDLWLTRNGHGAGFWDRGLDEAGELLTAKAKEMGGQDLYLGDDNKLWLSGSEQAIQEKSDTSLATTLRAAHADILGLLDEAYPDDNSEHPAQKSLDDLQRHIKLLDVEQASASKKQSLMLVYLTEGGNLDTVTDGDAPYDVLSLDFMNGAAGDKLKIPQRFKALAEKAVGSAVSQWPDYMSLVDDAPESVAIPDAKAAAGNGQPLFWRLERVEAMRVACAAKDGDDVMHPSVNEVAGMLADLQHWCCHHDVDFDRAVNLASDLFKEEVAEDRDDGFSPS